MFHYHMKKIGLVPTSNLNVYSLKSFHEKNVVMRNKQTLPDIPHGWAWSYTNSPAHVGIQGDEKIHPSPFCPVVIPYESNDWTT